MRRLVVGLVLGAVGCGGGRTEAADMEDVCHAGERSGADKVAPHDRASHTWQWIEKRVKSASVMKDLESLGGHSGHTGRILRLLAREHGYTGPCPMGDWTAEDDRGVLEALRGAKDPRDALERGALREYDAIYDLPLEDETRNAEEQHAQWKARDELLSSRDPAPLAKRLAKAGCPELAASFAPTEPRARDLLAACKPRGPALLAAREVDATATVFDASRALWLDALASPQRRASELHDAIVDVLLGPAQPPAP